MADCSLCFGRFKELRQEFASGEAGSTLMSAATVAFCDERDVDLRFRDDVCVDSVVPIGAIIGEKQHRIVLGRVEAVIDGGRTMTG